MEIIKNDCGRGYGEARVPLVLGGHGNGRADERAAQSGEASQALRQSETVPGGDGDLRRDVSVVR